MRISFLEEIAQDVRFGIRTLIKNPGVTIIAALSLALATGATTAIFSLVYSVVLRPLPFGEPRRLVQIAETSMLRDDLEQLRAESRAFEAFSEYSVGTRNLHTSSTVERITTVVSDRVTLRGAGRPADCRACVSTGRSARRRHQRAIVAVAFRGRSECDGQERDA